LLNHGRAGKGANRKDDSRKNLGSSSDGAVDGEFRKGRLLKTLRTERNCWQKNLFILFRASFRGKRKGEIPQKGKVKEKGYNTGGRERFVRGQKKSRRKFVFPRVACQGSRHAILFYWGKKDSRKKGGRGQSAGAGNDRGLRRQASLIGKIKEIKDPPGKLAVLEPGRTERGSG